MDEIKERSKIAKMRKAGLLPPGFVTAAPARDHAIYLHTHPNGGMALRQIARVGGVGESTISELIAGFRNGGAPIVQMRRKTSDAILSVRYEEPDTERGAKMPSTGIHRRLDALACAGYPYQLLSTLLGHSGTSRSYVGMLVRNNWTHVRVWREVDAMYRKYRDVDPADLGVGPNSKSRIQAYAARRGAAPAHCWDDDLIDKEDAIPEWTGACGSMQGWQLHYRNKIPQCLACREAKAVHSLNYKNKKKES